MIWLMLQGKLGRANFWTWFGSLLIMLYGFHKLQVFVLTFKKANAEYTS
jgi:uncharacterized membrane protein YhaH (DUF805 family)